MSNINVDNLSANSIQTDELYSGNVVVTGAARFVQPIYANIYGSKNINQVTSSSTIPDSCNVIISDGNSLRRILFSDLVSAIATKLGINPGEDYLFDD